MMSIAERDRSGTDDLVARVGRLEREGRYWRRCSVSLLGLVGILSLVAAGSQDSQTLTVSEIVVGAAGNPMVRITSNRIVLVDASGTERIELEAKGETAAVSVRSGDASTAFLVASPAGGTGLSVVDKEAKPRLGATLHPEGHARFFTKDASGTVTFQGPVETSPK